MASIRPATTYEEALYVGITLQNILYGVELVFYLRTMRVFLARRKKPHRLDAFFAAFSTVMFFLITSWVITDAIIVSERLWLLDRNYPGGPLAYLVSPAFVPFNHYQTAATIILQQMTDDLMVWRCQVVWDSFYVIIVPCFLCLATFVFGVLSGATQQTNPTIGIAIIFTRVAYSISVFVSAAMTCMICYRLWRHAKVMKKCIGAEFASPYITTAMLFVESVLPYTLTGILFLATFWARSWVAAPLSRVYTLMMCISPQMLILRVAEGTAWQKDTIKMRTTAIVFNAGDDTSDQSCSDGREVHKHVEPMQGISCPESGLRKTSETV